MESKNYLLLARSGDGFIQEKVCINCDIDTAHNMVKLIMSASPRLVRGEVIEGNRNYISDFSVKPCLFVYRDQSGTYTSQTERR